MSETKEFDMPRKMEEDEFKACVYGHIHQLRSWEEAESLMFFKQFLGYMVELKPYFCATFMPKRGKYLLTFPEEEEENLKNVVENILTCEKCLEKKEEILDDFPDLFGRDAPVELVFDDD